MKIMHALFLTFLIVPFVEIYLLLQVGSVIGTFPTVLLVVLTATLGAWLLRQQGFATWNRFQNGLRQGEIPAYEMVEGPVLLVGGALLLTPGFFTDLCGFACLIPAVRRKIADYLIERHLSTTQAGSIFRHTARDRSVIDGEYEKH
ncbi:FxsA family protein [Methylomonas koyamae]|uniref:FxsA family protein n=1 Tax=Methylomonas koyamae TaxID=702114 RepID=UPI00112CC5A8|nr:FxsA family protein [Methylomonas koyamae]TPQ27217.1 exlusion protein FxsA [Methylomonas koyamae]